MPIVRHKSSCTKPFPSPSHKHLFIFMSAPNFSSHLKLSKFFNSELGALKRYKQYASFGIFVSISFFYVVLVCSSMEQSLLHKYHFSTIYQVCYDSIYQLNEEMEGNEVVGVLQALHHLFFDIQEQIAKKWQLRSLTALFTDLLRYEQASVVREKAFEIMLLVIDALGEVDNPLVGLFQAAIPLQNFCENDSKLELMLLARLPKGL